MNGASHVATDDPRARMRAVCLLVGLGGLGAAVAGFFADREQFARSWLLGWVLWSGVSVGSLAVLSLHHLVGGAWGRAGRPYWEAAAATLPMVAVLFVPVALNLGHIYPWTHEHEDLGPKAQWLNTPFFLVRAFVYFAIWGVVTFFFLRWGTIERRSQGDPAARRRLRLLGGPGLIIMTFTVTLASVDWMMSLEPHWHSSVYGPMVLVGWGLSALALAIVALAARGNVDRDLMHDLGNLLLTFVMLWAYLAFSQYLIIWSANIPEETPWYASRVHGPWQGLGLALVILHFAVPFLLLLSRRTKRSPQVLASLAGALLFMRLIDLAWLILPSFHHDHARLHVLDLAMPLAVGGLWLAAFVPALVWRRA